MDSWTKFFNGSIWSHPIFNFVTKNSFSCSPSLSFLECGISTSTGLCTSDRGISWSPFETFAQLHALTCQELEHCEYSPCPPHKLTLGCLWNASEGGRGRQREAGREEERGGVREGESGEGGERDVIKFLAEIWSSGSCLLVRRGWWWGLSVCVGSETLGNRDSCMFQKCCYPV